MPLLTRYFIRTGLLYFGAGLLVGVLLLAQPLLGLPAAIAVLTPVYLHLLMVGWVMQLIIGVVYWMFPRHMKEEPRGSETLGWAVFVMLNVGLLLRALGEPLVALQPEANAGWILALSAVLQWLAGWGFIVNTWPRVKER